VANGPYVGAAYALAPDARIDDGLLDVVVFRDSSVLRVLIHLAFVAGGRPVPPPAHAQTLRVRSVRIANEEAGAALGISPVTVRVRIHRARGTLKPLLRPEVPA